MTEREAIEIIEYASAFNREDSPLTLALEKAIEALRKLSIYEQVKCERDIAIEQLEEIGLCFGEKTDRVKEALKKQNPKKPIDAITSDNEFICMICPCCQEVAVEFNDVYCRRCGQKLDWSEEELWIDA